VHEESHPRTSTNLFSNALPDTEKYVELLGTPITYERIREIAHLDELRKNLMVEADWITDAGKDLTRKEEKGEATLKSFRKLEAKYKEIISVKMKELSKDLC
jgi:hypothetical protein